MLAYVFWHAPAEGADSGDYEQAQQAFHRSLARSRPVGMRGSATFRVGDCPWLAAGGYEDWYLVEDYAALGVLNEAAVGRGHRTAHDRAAHRLGVGAGALFAFCEGNAAIDAIGQSTLAVWVARVAGVKALGMGEMLGDGIEPARASLWRRQLVLGPAPEFCLLCDELNPGVDARRLPAGWSARRTSRETVWHG